MEEIIKEEVEEVSTEDTEKDVSAKLKEVLKDVPDLEDSEVDVVEQEHTTKEYEEATDEDIEEGNFGI